MDARLFDALTRTLAAPGSRRGLLARIASLPILGSLAAIAPSPPDADAARRSKRKRRNNTVRAEGPCGDGSPKANRCKKNRECCTGRCRKKKNGRGRCRCFRPGEACTENQQCCPKRSGATCQNGICTRGQPCDIPCGAECCAEGQTCVEGSCSPPPCEVPCGAECCAEVQTCVAGDCCYGPDGMDTLLAALSDPNGPETIRLCAGEFEPGAMIEVARPVTIIGAGQGDNPAVDTILTRSGPKFYVTGGTEAMPVALQDLAVTGGGIGISVENTGHLRMTDCTVQGNSGSYASGIYNLGGLTMERCQIRDNGATGGFAEYDGGGLRNSGNATLIDCCVTGNRQDRGGGIYNSSAGTLTLEDTRVFANTAVNTGGGVYNAGTGIVNIEGDTIICNNTLDGNTPDDCDGFMNAACGDSPACPTSC
jgi:hypothetical protein